MAVTPAKLDKCFQEQFGEIRWNRSVSLIFIIFPTLGSDLDTTISLIINSCQSIIISRRFPTKSIVLIRFSFLFFLNKKLIQEKDFTTSWKKWKQLNVYEEGKGRVREKEF